MAEIRQLAHYEIRPESMPKVLAAIKEFVAYVKSKEAGTLRYDVWQQKDHPTRFTHCFIFRDEGADQAHSESAAVKKFAGILYPECLEPVQFVDYTFVEAKSDPLR
jgi:quinol monooxygenase YgiN